MCVVPPPWPGVTSVLCGCLSVSMLSCPNTCSQLGTAYASQKTACRSRLRADLFWGCTEEVTRMTTSGSPWSCKQHISGSLFCSEILPRPPAKGTGGDFVTLLQTVRLGPEEGSCPALPTRGGRLVSTPLDEQAAGAAVPPHAPPAAAGVGKLTPCHAGGVEVSSQLEGCFCCFA